MFAWWHSSAPVLRAHLDVCRLRGMRRTMFCQGLTTFLLLFAMHGAAVADSSSGFNGEWILPLGVHTMLVLSVQLAGGKGQAVSGSLSRPKHLATMDMISFSRLEGPVEVEPIVASEWKGSSLSITVRNPTDKSDESTYVLSVKDATHAELQLVGVPFPPMNLVRALGPVSVSEDWEPGRTYSPDDDAASNPEMKRIFDEDQRVRQPGLKIDWAVVSKSDAARRDATMKLLNEGALHSGEDFMWAANVFQHGDLPNDYLLAHTLAMIAVRRGYSDGIWIAAATLDRYLQMMKQPQIYGTQFMTPKVTPTTQEPYDRTLISDSLRHLLDVPSLAAQEQRCKQYDAERDAAK